MDLCGKVEWVFTMALFPNILHALEKDSFFEFFTLEKNRAKYICKYNFTSFTFGYNSSSFGIDVKYFFLFSCKLSVRCAHGEAAIGMEVTTTSTEMVISQHWNLIKGSH